MDSINRLFNIFLEEYGPQGWWPINGQYSGRLRVEDRFEVCVGAILTQNTSWKQVEKALGNLRREELIDASRIIMVSIEKLRDLIKPAGYFNQKAKKLKLFAEFFISLGGRIPTRQELLGIWGIGPETADSILCYAYEQAYFTVDAYTKRIFTRIGVVKADASYDEIQLLVHKAFFDEKEKAQVFNEFHALIVEHAKRNCMKKARCEGCVVREECANL